jgi:hypothetical protein
MRTKINTTQFNRDMKNLVNYSLGFLEGAQLGKKALFHRLAPEVIEMFKQYVDSNARANPSSLHHVYEWYQSGSPDARLFDIDYTVSGIGLSFRSTFSQSVSIQQGSSVPFHDKARLMEAGVSATIRPRNAEALRFEIDGETVFSKSPTFIPNVGGTATTGGFESIFDEFFSKYFSQAFLRLSGISKTLNNPIVYKRDLPAGLKGGKSVGLKTGFRWVANAGVGT